MQIITSHLLNEAAELKRKTVYYVSLFIHSFFFFFASKTIKSILFDVMYNKCSYTSDIELITRTHTFTNNIKSIIIEKKTNNIIKASC